MKKQLLKPLANDEQARLRPPPVHIVIDALQDRPDTCGPLKGWLKLELKAASAEVATWSRGMRREWR